MALYQPNPNEQPAPTPTTGKVGGVVNDMLNAQALDNTKAEVQKLVDSANSGGFAINEEGADAYIRAFREFIGQLTDIQTTLFNASQAPQLGTSPYAQQVAAHTQTMATGDPQSFEAALNSLTVIVKQAVVAFEQAKKNYAQMEDEAVQTFKGLTD